MPSYAVPVEDVDGDIIAATGDVATDLAGATTGARRLGEHIVLDPSIPFSVHTADGDAVTVRPGDGDRAAAGFLPADPALSGRVVLDFDDFDAWYEEDELNVAHPRDPFHRIDILHSSRHVHVEVDGVVIADSTAPYLLFEPPLPVRYYLPVEDVRTELLQPERHHDVLRLQGRGVVLVDGRAARRGVDLPRPAAGSGRDRRPDRVLQRAGRPRRRRRHGGAARHAVVAPGHMTPT